MSRLFWRITFCLLLLIIISVPATLFAQDGDTTATPEIEVTEEATATDTENDIEATPEPTEEPEAPEATPESTEEPEATADESDSVSATISIDGSATMQDVLTALVDTYTEQTEEAAEFAVATGGPNGAFTALCSGELDLAMSTRYLTDEEAATCEANGIEFVETLIGYEALVVVFSPNVENAPTCIGLDQLDSLYGLTAENTDITLDLLIPPALPVDGEVVATEEAPAENPLLVYAPASDSAAAEILPSILPGGETRTDLETTYSEPGDVIELLTGETPAIAYMTLAQFSALEDAESMTALEIRNPDNGNCFAPVSGNIETGSYVA
ncbi:MAG TPA: substrate-binding domain-containing protein, partial [Aggregatilineales bacterium]|nr:substrate-binding domain-containing protein [Aggregatilineales bacterium]